MMYDGSKFNPQVNLPQQRLGKTPEADLTKVFIEGLISSFKHKSYDLNIVREFPLHGYGIADLVVTLTQTVRNTENGNRSYRRTIILTFEIKISDWKRAIQQAYRYRYYSNLSIIVLPVERKAIITNHIKLLKKLHIGVWLVDKHGTLSKLYTPRYQKPISRSTSKRARCKLSDLIQLDSVPKYFNAFAQSA